MEQGSKSGAATLALHLRRVGALPLSVTARIKALSLKQLERLSDALLDFTSAKDLQQWLRIHAPVRRKRAAAARKR
jgi:hypothetical protein